jgi:hypothetical protein
MCICIVVELVHPLHFSPLYLSPLPVVISIVSKILHSFLCCSDCNPQCHVEESVNRTPFLVLVLGESTHSTI